MMEAPHSGTWICDLHGALHPEFLCLLSQQSPRSDEETELGTIQDLPRVLNQPMVET